MTTERFTKSEFEAALTIACQGLKWECLGYVSGEIRYFATVKSYQGHSIVMNINSSIGADGRADDTDKNSIRVWLMSGSKPIAEKTQAYVTRVKGWQERLSKAVAETVAIAKDIPYCRKCGSVMLARVSKYGPYWACSAYPLCRESWDTKNTRTSDLHNTPPPDMLIMEPAIGAVKSQEPESSEEFNQKWAEHKNNFAKLEAKLEQKGFASDPDYQRSLEEHTQVAVATKAEFIPSKYQTAIFEWGKGTRKVLVVRARAGSGKTTTGLRMLGYLPYDLSIRFLAFNHQINKTVGEKLEELGITWVTHSTYHSLGWSACRRAFKNIKLNEDKVYLILRNVIDMQTCGYLVGPIRQLVSLVKYNLSGASDAELDAIADHQGIEMNGDRDMIYDAVRITLKKCMEMTDMADYDDQCWLPIILNLPLEKFDFLFVDEFQDTNKNQGALALNSLKPDGRIVCVGDEFQSLYGFRGADIDAIPNFINTMKADVLPLSVTYRNPKSVVALVNQKFPEIGLECPDTAKEGIIRHITEQTALVEYTGGDMVLCRTNAPLVRPAFNLIARGIKATIRGRDISSGLLVLIKKMKQDTLIDLIQALTDYKEQEMPKLIAAKKSSQAQSIEDKVDTIVALADGSGSITELLAKINDIFSDDAEGVVFSSVHKAKGLEAERVFILRPDLMPHPMAKQEWEQVQERNIEYVAITRTLSELIYVEGTK